jgi:hypothetical protein
MEIWFKLAAWNSQSLFGFGTEREADTYTDLLNRNREINRYHATAMDPGDCAALNSGDDTDGFRLDLAIDTIREWAC